MVQPTARFPPLKSFEFTFRATLEQLGVFGEKPASKRVTILCVLTTEAGGLVIATTLWP